MKIAAFTINSVITLLLLLLFGQPYIIESKTRKDDTAMDYISAPEAARKWGISERRVQKLCEENRISGVIRFSRMWLIPQNTEKPADRRVKCKRGLTK